MKTIELKGEKEQLKKILFALAERNITVSIVDAPPATSLTTCSRQRPQPVSSSPGPHYRHHHQLHRDHGHQLLPSLTVFSPGETLTVRASVYDESWVTLFFLQLLTSSFFFMAGVFII